MKIEINNEIFLELYNSGYSDCKIAKILNVSDSKIRKHRLSLNLNTKFKKENSPIELTKEQVEILVGTILGDASIRKIGKYLTVIISQSMIQENYCLWKFNKLSNLSNKVAISKRKVDSRTNKYYEAVTFSLKSNSNLQFLYDLFIENNKKVIKDIIYDYITPLSLAVWFMDDGKSASYGYEICSESFSFSENNVLIEIINTKFNLNLKIKKSNNSYRIAIPSSEKEKFANLIRPYMIDSMKYKLCYWKGDKFKAVYKSCELLENPEEDNQQPSQLVMIERFND